MDHTPFADQGAGSVTCCCFCRLLLDDFEFDGDLDLVTDQNAASLQCLIPGQVPVFAIDRGGGTTTGTGSAPRAFRLTGVLDLKHDFPCDIANGQGDSPPAR